MQKRWLLLVLPALVLLGMGANPRYLESLRIGGGYGDAADGGLDIEANGDLNTDGEIAAAALSLETPLGDASVADDITITEADTLDAVAERGATTDVAITVPTVDTGQGANELYDMDQDVQTTDDVTFASATASGAVPAFFWNETDATTDEGKWDLLIASGKMRLRTLDDSGAFGAFVLDIDRTGTAANGAEFHTSLHADSLTLDTDLADADVADNLTISSSGSVATEAIAQNSATSGQVLKWNGSAWAPAADADSGSAATAAVVGGMVTGNTETLIAVTYESGDDTLDFVVDDDLSGYDWSSVDDADIPDAITVGSSGSVSNDALSTDVILEGNSIGGITPAAGYFTTFAASSTFSLSGDQVQISEGGTGASTAAGARAALDLEPGVDVYAYGDSDVTLDSEWNSIGELESATGADIITEGESIGGTTPAAGTFTSVTSKNSAPGYAWWETDATTDEGRWDVLIASGKMRLRTLDDSGTLGEFVLDFDRTGTDATSAVLNAALDAESLTLDTALAVAEGGTGATTASGARTNLGVGSTDNVTFNNITANELTIDKVSLDNFQLADNGNDAIDFNIDDGSTWRNVASYGLDIADDVPWLWLRGGSSAPFGGQFAIETYSGKNGAFKWAVYDDRLHQQYISNWSGMTSVRDIWYLWHDGNVLQWAIPDLRGGDPSGTSYKIYWKTDVDGDKVLCWDG